MTSLNHLLGCLINESAPVPIWRKIPLWAPVWPESVRVSEPGAGVGAQISGPGVQFLLRSQSRDSEINSQR